MQYVTRNRYRESVKAEMIPEINRHIDAVVIPALEKVEGTRSVQVYNSFNGEIVFVLDIQNLAAIDRVLTDPGVKAALADINDYFTRTGGEILFDRHQWEGLYGRQ